MAKQVYATLWLDWREAVFPSLLVISGKAFISLSYVFAISYIFTISYISSSNADSKLLDITLNL